MLFDFLSPETAILEGLSDFKPEFDIVVTDDILPDKYIAASALQKALRRKNWKQAMFAAKVLKQIDEGYLFRRLKCCALEDCGPAALDVVSQVLWVGTKREWMLRHGGGDFVLAYLIKRLCEAKAVRTTDNLIYAACKSPIYASQREIYSGMTQDELLEAFVSKGLDGVELTLISYFICGTRYPCDDLDLRKGNPDLLFELCYSLGIPPFVTDVLRLSRSYEFFISLVPAWMQLERAKKNRLVDEVAEEPVMIGPWPSECMDRHTIVGKKSYRMFLKKCPSVSAFLQNHLPTADHVNLVAWAFFILEGQLLNNKVEYSGSQCLQELTEAAWMKCEGMTHELQITLLDRVKNNMTIIHDIRREIVS